MPAYTTISCSFDKRDRAGLVRAFYDSFMGDGVAFDRVFAWGCEPDLTLDQIVQWNQAKLDADFMLGLEQHVSHDFRQIVLAVPPFSECRLIVFNGESRIAFHCIVPEHEIDASNTDSLEDACCRVWRQLPVLAIESYGEIGCDVGNTAIASGQAPSADLFAVIDYDCTQQDYASGFHIRQMERGYFLRPM